MLKPQDIMVIGWLALQGRRSWRYIDMAQELGLSQSESHAAVKRLLQAQLVLANTKSLLANRPLAGSPGLNHKAALEFILYGVPYVFYPERGAATRGMPTGAAAPPLNEHFQLGRVVPVWPDAEGTHRGYALSPLYRSAPHAAKNNAGMYKFLALVDALRDGMVRERKLARKYLEKMIHGEQG